MSYKRERFVRLIPTPQAHILMFIMIFGVGLLEALVFWSAPQSRTLPLIILYTSILMYFICLMALDSAARKMLKQNADDFAKIEQEWSVLLRRWILQHLKDVPKEDIDVYFDVKLGLISNSVEIYTKPSSKRVAPRLDGETTHLNKELRDILKRHLGRRNARFLQLLALPKHYRFSIRRPSAHELLDAMRHAQNGNGPSTQEVGFSI